MQRAKHDHSCWNMANLFEDYSIKKVKFFWISFFLDSLSQRIWFWMMCFMEMCGSAPDNLIWNRFDHQSSWTCWSVFKVKLLYIYVLSFPYWFHICIKLAELKCISRKLNTWNYCGFKIIINHNLPYQINPTAKLPSFGHVT